MQILLIIACKVAPDKSVTTLAGTGDAAYADGPGTLASFRKPIGAAVDIDGNVVIADTLNHRIRRTASERTVTTLAGRQV